MLATITGTGNGTKPVVNITFPFIDKSHVIATVDGVSVAYTWTGTSQITFSANVANGAKWAVARKTPTSPAAVDFTDGAVLTEADLDLAEDAHRYRDEEIADLHEQTAADLVAESAARAAAVTDEQTARAAADSSEQTSRIAADAALQAAIDAEESARIAADDGLSDRISAIRIPPPFIVDGVGTGEYPLDVFTPEQFGAVGDGVADDGAALNLMGQAVSAAGRGLVWLRQGKTYGVGGQTLNGAVPDEVGGGVYTFAPNTAYIIPIIGTTGPVVIHGNGARIRTLDGNKYGAFNEDGTARADAVPFYGAAGVTGKNAATPYLAMLYVKDASGPVHIQDIELDGNIAGQVIGGNWGDSHIQLGMSGMELRDNTGPIVTKNILSHHHGLDGGIGNGPGVLNVKEHVRIHGWFRNNGRQGFSLVGGNGWHFEDGSEFSGTGKDLGPTMTWSAPGAGIDMEAEGGKYVVNTTMGAVLIADNTGANLVSDTNPLVSGLTVHGATIIGTTSQAVIFRNPAAKFHDCTIVGQIENPHPDDDPNLAFQMIGGKWTDDTSLSPTGVVYGVTPAGTLMPSAGVVTNVLFDGVTIERLAPGIVEAMGQYATTMDGNTLRFHNCTFRKTDGSTTMFIYGTFSGPKTRLINTNSAPLGGGALGGINDAGVALDSFQFENNLGGFAYAKTRYPASIDHETGLRVLRGTAAPTSGTWVKGDKVINTNPTAGGFTGWVCTVAGSPGTWKGYGAIAA